MTEQTIEWRILTVAIGLLVTLIGVIWRLSGAKSELHKSWRDRISLMESGLEELASEKLLALRGMVNDLLGEENRFDPTRVVENPAKVKAPAREFLVLLKKRRRVRQYFWLLVNVPQVIMFACIGLLMAGFSFALNYFELMVADWLRSLGCWLGGVSSVVAFLGFVIYVSCHYLLGNTDVMVAEGRGHE